MNAPAIIPRAPKGRKSRAAVVRIRPTADPLGDRAKPVWRSAAVPRKVQPPLFATPPLGRKILTWGPVVADHAARRTGVMLTPWQRFALDRLLEVDPDTRRLRARSAFLSVGRRNGKTTCLRVPLAWLLDSSPIWELAAVTAPTRDQVYQALFAELAKDVMPLGMEAQPSGDRAGIGYDGSNRRLFMISGKHDAFRGRTFDVAVLDEGQTPTVDPSSLAAIEPTTRTRDNGLVIITGTAGTERSVLFRTLYDRAILAVARPEDDPRFVALVWEGTSDSDAGIMEANPGVRDGLLDMGILRDTRRSLPVHLFRSETLNQWGVDATNAWAPPGSWDACGVPSSVAPAGAVPMFGIDVMSGWTHGTVTVATPDGEQVHVEVAREWHAPEQDELVGYVRDLLARYRRSRVAYDVSSPIAAAMGDLKEQMPDRVVELGGAPFREACGELLGMVISRTLRHRADPVLDSAARVAARSDEAEAWRFIRRKSAAACDALIAATCSVHLAQRPGQPTPRIHVHRR
jgi:hypothetical protein